RRYRSDGGNASWQNGQADRTGRGADPMIETEHEEVVERFLGTESARKMKGVEGPDRLHGKRTARAVDHGRADGHQCPVPRPRLEESSSFLDLHRAEVERGPRPDECPVTFDERQLRGEDMRRLGERSSHPFAPGLAEQ